jgi:hypothetical protein
MPSFPKLSVLTAKNFTSISINIGLKIINARNRTQIIYGCPRQIITIRMCRIFTPQQFIYRIMSGNLICWLITY